MNLEEYLMVLDLYELAEVDGCNLYLSVIERIYIFCDLGSIHLIYFNLYITQPLLASQPPFVRKQDINLPYSLI